VNWDLRRTAKYYFIRLKRLRGTPQSLARGAAIGAAIAITPTLPLHTIMIIPTTLILRVSTIAAMITGAIISNPLTFVPQYWLAWWIGNLIFPDRLSWSRLKTVLHTLLEEGLIDSLHTLSKLSADALLVLSAGGIILAIIFGFSTYFIAFNFFLKIQQKRLQKHLLH
jgi:uncharacterized protein (DUF2062 family)